MAECDSIIKEYLSDIQYLASTINYKDINRVAVLIYEAWRKEKAVYLCGNGGSASTASHTACDFSKLGIKVHCLNDNPALITAITNDNGFSELYVEQLKNSITAGDVLICFSVHGGAGADKADAWSQNIIKAAQLAIARNAKVIGFIGYDGGLLKGLSDASIIIGSSTPQVESWHLALEHLICLILRQYKPVKYCKFPTCGKIYPVDMLACPHCGAVSYEFASGVTGNIEELKK
jgi:D-sedoheptulose 7-phosphate isomerase